MKTILVPVVLLILAITHYGNSAKILGLFTAPSRSHYILGSALMKGLAEKGHDVTVISAYGEKQPPKGKGTYRDIVVTEIQNSIQEMLKNEKMSMVDRENLNPFFAALFVGHVVPKLMEPVLSNEGVQQLIHSKEKFDVVIIEQFLNDAQKALATHFGAPLVLLSTVGANFWINSLVGNPGPTSYIPALSLGYTVPMTFRQRLSNTLLTLLNEVYYPLYVHPNENAKIKKYIPNGPDISDVLYNVSLVLMNSHPSTNQPVPYVPNMIDIAGFHIKPPKKLPQDLQEFLDSAKDGVIYFSMGSNLKSADFLPEKRDAVLKTFSTLKEKILWKWEDDVLPGQPKNVKLSKWLPQQDILAHLNVKLFITHGGFLSTAETIYHGVPVLAIPIFGDQKLNAKSAVRNGFGIALPYSELTEETFAKSVHEILTNPKYKTNAKKRSELFHDRLVGPMDTAMYWIEYVIRHKGAPHLRVAAVDLPWYKYHLLDVIGFLVLVSLGLVLVSYYVVKIVCRKLCSKQKIKKVKKH